MSEKTCETCQNWRPKGESLDPPVIMTEWGWCVLHNYGSTADVGCGDHRPKDATDE
jgi:hypothetical protein